MRDVLASIRGWRKSGNEVALATVVETWGSSPRRVGAKMALTASGQIAGSVSGGCVEGAVAEAGHDVLEGAEPRLLHFGVADETAWSVGLACGGEIDVFVDRLADEQLEFVGAAIEANEAVATLTVIDGPAGLLGRRMTARGGSEEKIVGRLGEELDEAAQEKLRRGLRINRSFRSILESPQAEVQVEVFVDVIPAPMKMVIVGGVHIAIALSTMASLLGQEVIVIDPRSAFGSPDRFSRGEKLIQAWPQQAMADLRIDGSTAVVVLTHDPKIDDPAIIAALASPAYYIGALGSRRTHAKRLGRLRSEGIGEEALARLHAPIGLDIGAQTPEEIAVAILGEVIRSFRQTD